MKLYVEGYDREKGDYVGAIGDKWKTAHYVYADGELEWRAGYDIVRYSEDDTFDFVTDRIEQVVAVLPDGEELEATLFYWHSAPYDDKSARFAETHPNYLAHGRLVLNSDKKAMNIAKKKYEKKDALN